MREQNIASPDDIDLTELWATLRRAAPKLLAVSAAAGLVTYVVLSLMAPRYESQAELAIVAKGAANPFSSPANPLSGSDTLPARMDREAVNTHVRSLLSSSLASQVAKELDLKSYKEFNPSLGPLDSLEAVLHSVGLGGVRPGISTEDLVLNEFYSRLDVYSPSESRVINIRFTSIDPNLAAGVANALAEAYRERLASTTVAETDNVQKLLAPRIEELSKEVAKAEGEVADFRARAGLLRSGADETPIGERQLGEIASELTKASAATTVAQTRAKAARQLLAKGTPEFIPEVQASPIIQNLIQQRVTVDRDLLKLSATMKPAHPVIRQLKADRDAVKNQISTEVANLVAGLDREALIAAEQEAAVRKSLNEVENKIAANGNKSIELRQLEAKAAAKRGELERLQAQYEANRARADGGLVPVEAQIITLARPSSVPVFPRKLSYTLLVMLGVLLLATAVVVTVGLAAGARRTSDAEQLLSQDIALLAASTPPEPQSAAPSPAGLSAASEQAASAAPLLPEFRTPAALAAHLHQSAATARTGLRTMLASELGPAATAALAREVAIALVASGAQTLLIDGNIDGRSLAEELETARVPGLTDLLDGKASFSDVVHRLPGTDAHVIASGAADPKGRFGFDPDQLNMILDALDEAYDQIIVAASLEPARNLFETIQGRFDVGVTVEQSGLGSSLQPAEHGTYLGFVVSDIDLLRYEAEPESAKSKSKTRAFGTQYSARIA